MRKLIVLLALLGLVFEATGCKLTEKLHRHHKTTS